ncbi:hypothetical protein GGR55DRAFT_651207 [Xylaria sp. FL0064]|nr:hypothetical protein GGR55DRAFT_651207 [Xylaria sp. FL0064]
MSEVIRSDAMREGHAVGNASLSVEVVLTLLVGRSGTPKIDIRLLSENQSHQSSCSADGSQHQSTNPATQFSPMDWGGGDFVLWNGGHPLEGVLGPELPGQQNGSDRILGAEADFGPEPTCSFDTSGIQGAVYPSLSVESLEGGDPGDVLTFEPCPITPRTLGILGPTMSQTPEETHTSGMRMWQGPCASIEDLTSSLLTYDLWEAKGFQEACPTI